MRVGRGRGGGGGGLQSMGPLASSCAISGCQDDAAPATRQPAAQERTNPRLERSRRGREAPGLGRESSGLGRETSGLGRETSGLGGETFGFGFSARDTDKTLHRNCAKCAEQRSAACPAAHLCAIHGQPNLHAWLNRQASQGIRRFYRSITVSRVSFYVGQDLSWRIISARTGSGLRLLGAKPQLRRCRARSTRLQNLIAKGAPDCRCWYDSCDLRTIRFDNSADA